MSRIRGIYEDFQVGDPISNGELDYAITYFKRLSDDLGALGPVFRLAWCEAVRVLDRLEDFKLARSGKQ